MEFKLVDFQASITYYSILLIFLTLMYKNCPRDACAVFIFGISHASLWKKKTFLPSWLAASFINCLTLRIRYIHLPCEKLTKSQNDSRCWEWPSDGTGSVCHSKYTASVEHYAGWWHCLFMLLPLFTRSDFLDIGNVKYLPTLILCHIFLWGTTLLFICCFCNDATCSSDYI